ncbi:hypothetical protein BamMEX5DRAFT_4509 [Burkholderia ambifaria MEX-5]|uniref:Uncharacterized protein n=1 Tax=Burkholderia ambifaria MEX-5 TaxID=396597 RepID=B1T9P3_9BURK|nr:hypothetical protein BamMEX5DRAFT_4509 [Burkholderia ambifaria MEX-5]
MKVVRVRERGSRAFAVVRELLQRVGARRRQQPVARHAVCILDVDERLRHKAGDRVEQVRIGEPLRADDVPHRLDRKTVAEHAEPAQQHALLVPQQAVAPVVHGLQRPVAWQCRAKAAGQQPEMVVEMIGQYVDAEHGRTGGGQLDRQRQAVEMSANRRHQGHAAFVERKARIGGARACSEQLHRACAQRVGCVGTFVADLERWHRALSLTVDAKRLAAGRQHAQPGIGLGQHGGDPRGSVKQMLAIVEHEQHPAMRDARQHRFERQRAGRQRDVQRVRQRGGDELRARNRRQRHERRAIRKARLGPDRGFDRDARLADAARPDQRHDARRVERREDIGDHLLPPHERGRRGREPGRRGTHGGRAFGGFADEPIAAPRHRDDQIPVLAQRLAQRRDMHLQVVFLHECVRPHALHDLVFRDQRAICLNQEFENFECTAADAQQFAVRANFTSVEKNVKRSNADHGRV